MVSVLTKTKQQRDTGAHWEVLDMFLILIVVMASQVHTYIQTHQIVHTKYMQIFACQFYPNSAVRK